MAGPVDIIATCTVRIVGSKAGVDASIGTGFLYAFPVEDAPDMQPGRIAPVVVTNKHVIDGCDEIAILLTVAPKDAALDTAGQPEGRHYFTVRIALAPDGVVRHPSPTVDLCALTVAMVLNDVETRGLRVHHAFLGPAFKLQSDQRSIIRAIEPIAMVGYPSGIWDSVNNAPIVRRGSTATHPLVHYEGRPEFLIDAACFPGSSGSPVFLFEDGMYRSGANSYSPGTRIAFLGVLYAGPQFTAEGRLEARPIPHAVVPTPITSMPMNLGFVIEADQVDALGLALLQGHS